MSALAQVMLVAGWDPSGAAGLAQDFRVCQALGVTPCGAAAALTAQGREGVAQVQGVDPALLRQQLEILFAEQPIAALKAGLLYGPAQVEVLASLLALHPGLPLVLDPVLGASAGGSLVAPGLIEALKARLLPYTGVLSPNLAEAAALTVQPLAASREAMQAQARALLALGPKAVLLKGGHLAGKASPDYYLDAKQEAWLEAPRVEGASYRGTGCALASAIAAYLALGSAPLQACRLAKAFLTQALRMAQAGAATTLTFNPASPPKEQHP